MIGWVDERLRMKLATTSPSSTAALAGRSCSSCAMEGKRSVKSCPLLYMTTREPILWA
jgi:hypothetical protein